ncbi:hypothetical protein NDN16_08070 [Aureimonas altamirensis]|uniref:hypothetical protein n=1 Tax=Aureimonas altamirensis TaxID=370622 RepID=UPI0020373AB9|nr:hypothetical protein [Aureimonas altamirensis]MCM2503629.1 hypothetical protein [Aureimonas altamirensis]
MNDAVRKLAQSMLDAEREKRAWNAGRSAFRERGEIAMNPNAPGSHEHGLWADGFAYERKRGAPQMRAASLPEKSSA